jgi:hypothetical protein
MASAAALADGALEGATAPRESVAMNEAAPKKAPAHTGQDRQQPHAKKLAANTGPATQSEAEAAKEATSGGDVKMSGMSVLGNDDSPKSLVIVPWKSSQLGDMPGLSKMLDDSTQPVDKEVFLRELSYYQIKVESK